MHFLPPLAAFGLATVLAAAPLGAQTIQLGASGAGAEQAGADTVIARIDGDALYLSELEIERLGLPEQYRDMALEQIYPQLVASVVERRLMAREAERTGMAKDPIVARLLRRARDLVLLEAFATRHVQPLLAEEAVRARWERDAAGRRGEEEVRARHILLESELDARAVAVELAGGADFAELAKTRSKGPSGPRGGDLGFFRKRDMVPAFAEVAFALAPGAVSEPVQTRFGWHIIKVEARRAGAGPAFEQVRDQIRSQIAQEKIAEILAELRAGAKVEVYTMEGKPVVGPGPVAPSGSK